MPVEIQILGADAAAQRLEQLDSRLKADLRPLFTSIGSSWASVFQGYFTSNDWAPLAATTIEERAREGFGPEPVLQRSGKLIDSILAKVESDQLRVGTDHISARLLNFGGRTASRSRYPDRPVPARPFIKLTDEAIDDAMVQVRAFFFDEGSPLDA